MDLAYLVVGLAEGGYVTTDATLCSILFGDLSVALLPAQRHFHKPLEG